MVAAVLAALAVPAGVRAGDPVLAAVGPLVRPLLTRNAGVVVGVRAGGASRVTGFGTVVTPTGKLRPDGRTLFEVGSVTKAFTGVLLADAVRRGEVALADPANRHLPPDLRLKSHPAGPVTLLDLATHRGGLPVEPPRIGLTARDGANPYADFTRPKLAALVAALRPAAAPGEKFVYSNLGAGLLGHALAAAANQTGYHALVQARVCGPLGLADTTEAPTGEQRSRLARGHDAAGNPAGPWDFATLEACGALRSTADDLLRFAAVNLGETASPLTAVCRASHAPRRGAEGLLWVNLPAEAGRPRTVWHNGGTGGYRSMLVLAPDAGLAVVVLTNKDSGDAVDDSAFAIITALARPPAK